MNTTEIKGTTSTRHDIHVLEQVCLSQTDDTKISNPITCKPLNVFEHTILWCVVILQVWFNKLCMQTLKIENMPTEFFELVLIKPVSSFMVPQLVVFI